MVTFLKDTCMPTVVMFHMTVYQAHQPSQYHTTTTTILGPFFRDHPGEPVPEQNFWTLWCKGRLTAADTLTIRMGATPYNIYP